LSDLIELDVAVIGGGVVGLAAAMSSAAQGWSVALLERHGRLGLDTSTHNSGVIHAGMYYPAGSLKAGLCVRGAHLLYEFCQTHRVPHERCGKLIVASSIDEVSALEALLARGLANGVERLTLVDAAFARAKEPHLQVEAALNSPDTGIVDADHLVKTLARVASDRGAAIVPHARLIGAESRNGAMVLHTERETLVARQVVNAAGLFADDVSRMLGGETFTIHPCRGEYAELAPSARSRVKGLIYPLPHGHGLGLHFVRTIGGAVLLGPTIRFQPRKDDYEDDRLPLDEFVAPAQRLVPSVCASDLRLSGSGIRAKLHGPDERFADFLIRRDRVNPLVVQAAGVDSPGLTASLAIAERVTQTLAEHL
jgi:L-2-hydroxyglutarate oxidase LhgO